LGCLSSLTLDRAAAPPRDDLLGAIEWQPGCLGCLSSLTLDRVAVPPCDELMTGLAAILIMVLRL